MWAPETLEVLNEQFEAKLKQEAAEDEAEFEEVEDNR